MPSFMLRRLPQFEVDLETVEEAVDRIIKNANQNFNTVKHMLYGNLDYVNLMNAGITSDKIAAEAITTELLAAGSVIAEKIAANTITANEIAANTITAAEIAANTITAAEIAANTITANELYVNELSAISADLGTITAGKLYIRHVEIGSAAADGTLNFAISNEFLTLRAAYTTAGNSLMLARTTSLGGALTALERVDINTTALYVYGALWVQGVNECAGGLNVSGGSVSGLRTNYEGPTNSGYTTVAAHNHGIADGTKLAVDGGGYVTWVAYAGDSHNHTVADHKHAVEQGSV